MYYTKIIILALFIFNASHLMAQDLTSHKWNNRTLLALTNDTENTIYKNQIDNLKECQNGLQERKLIIYQVKKDSCKIGLQDSGEWQKSYKLYKDYKKLNAPFEIILIGLDGGVKLRQSNILTCKELFKTIDVMPMRRSEINNN
tara:strand:+ start:1579 stop:2010 length:432 start_codon:yes stop_codon:yes gene_type:complete